MSNLSSQSDLDKHSIELAERAVCSILLFLPQHVERAQAAGLAYECFLDMRYAAIVRAILTQREAGEPIAPHLLFARMVEQGTAGRLHIFGGLAFLVELQNEATTADGLESYIHAILLAHHGRRASHLRDALRKQSVSSTARQRQYWELREAEQTITALYFAGDGWPEPLPLPTGLPSVPAMTPDMLPECFRAWLTDVAERLDCPLEYTAIPAMVALSSVVGRRCVIRPKCFDPWPVVPNLWGAIVGRSGFLKSPALNAALGPLRQLQTAARAKYQSERAALGAAEIALEAKREVLRGKIRAVAQEGADTEKLEDELSALGSTAPVLRRYIVNDVTVEKLGILMEQNPQGVLMLRDELAGWLYSLNRKGHESDRPFYLEAWNGDGCFDVDRVVRETAAIPALCLSIIGGIQPGPLSEHVRAALRPGADADGFMQRFQLMVYPDVPREIRNIDRAEDAAARQRAGEIFRRLDTLDPSELGAQHEQEGELPFLRFAPDAQPLADEFMLAVKQAVRLDGEHPALTSHESKYSKLMPALALLFHLAEWADGNTGGPVSRNAAALALRWCDYLRAHARRIYSVHKDGESSPARLLAERIKRRELSTEFSTRDVYQKGWTGLDDRAIAETAIKMLVEHEWLREERRHTRGRPAKVYHVNPKVYR